MALTSTKKLSFTTSRPFIRDYFGSESNSPYLLNTAVTGQRISNGTTVLSLKQSTPSYLAVTSYKGMYLVPGADGGPQKVYVFRLDRSNLSDALHAIPHDSIEMVQVKLKTN